MTFTIIYSFNKHGNEAAFWSREIASASTTRCRFIPFNHGPYLPPASYGRAQLLDNIYHGRNPALLRMYDDVRRLAAREQASAIVSARPERSSNGPWRDSVPRCDVA